MSGLLSAIIDFVFDNIVISIPQAQAKLGVTYATALKNVEKLVRLEILSEAVNTRPKLFLCEPLVDLVFLSEDFGSPPTVDTGEEQGSFGF
jgi:hypothetical protein